MHAIRKHLLFALFLATLPSFSLKAQSATSSPIQKEWTVDGVQRQALIFVPTRTSPNGAPIFFVFHGHGGTMNFSTRAKYQELWPEALVIYPQGLPTPGHLTDPDGKRSGWQFSEGEQSDRDLKFFDAMLTTAISDYHGNPKWVFTTGHSNGARFSHLLWAARGNKLTATAASASSALNLVKQYQPKPYLQISGDKDPLVFFALQQASLNAILKADGCNNPGQVEKHFPDADLIRYTSTSGTPVLFLHHQGGHTVPSEGPPVTIEFFKEFLKP